MISLITRSISTNKISLVHINRIFNYLDSAHKISSKTMSTSANLKFLTQDEAINLDKELFNEYGFSVDQLMELAGLSIATAISKTYPLEKHNKPVILCGPGNNGGDGFVCARHMKLFGYSPVIVCPKPGKGQLYQNLIQQCTKFDIDILDHFTKVTEPNLIVDAVFGFSYKPTNRNTDFARILNWADEMSKDVPLVSVDIPSGWDVESGYAQIDSAQDGLDPKFKLPKLKPDCLISLTAPKLCAKYFNGRYHYLGGRFCPESIKQKYRLNLPKFDGTDCIIRLNSNG